MAPGAKSRARRHRRKTRDTRATSELQQYGLELIVDVMGGEQALRWRKRTRKYRVTCFARSCLDGFSITTRNPDALNCAGNAELCTSGARGPRPFNGPGIQSVIDVNGAKSAAASRYRKLRQRGEQRGGIGAAAECNAVRGRERIGDLGLQQGTQPRGGKSLTFR